MDGLVIDGFYTSDVCGELLNSRLDDTLRRGTARFRVGTEIHLIEAGEMAFMFEGAHYIVDRDREGEVVDVRLAPYQPAVPAEPKQETVNHPKHYNSDPSGVECITIAENWNFNLGNALKYMWRAGVKSDTTHIEDLKKAVWYINREIERVSK
jgi:hypothetical protein